MIIREAIQKTVFSDISLKQTYASVMLPAAYCIQDYDKSYECPGLKPTYYACASKITASFDASISSYAYRLVSPINDLPYSIENIDITEQPKTFDDIDKPFVTPGTNVLNKYDYDLCKFIETEPIEFNSTYWTDLLQPSNFATLNFYEQDEKYKVFDCCTYSINNSYLDDMYNELYRSFDNVRRFTRESSNIIKTFSEYVSDNYSRAIVFEGLKENDVNTLDNESYISVYLKTLQLSNTDLFFKTSYNVHIDYDGQLHFFNNEVGYITAYCTSEPSLRKTIEVRTESEIAHEIASETTEDILTIDEFLKENHYSNEVKPILLCGDNEIITSVNITNGSGALTPIMPKVKLIDSKTINLIALGKGSFSINYSTFNPETNEFRNYNSSFIVKEKPICHAKNLLQFERSGDIINVKLNDDYMAPVTIVAQYNGYDKNDDYVSEHLVKGFVLNYLYTDASWATIEINASPDVKDKTKIPVRIYFINYDNSIYYQDWHPDTTEPVKGTFFSLRRSAGKFIDYLGNEYGKNLKQPLYNVEKVSKISPFVKISLALSEKPFNTFSDKNVVDKGFTELNTVDISYITNGLKLTATQSKTISAIEKHSITSYRLDNSIAESLISYVSNNIKKYLSLEGFDVDKSVFRPKALSYIDTILNNYSLNLNESFTDTPIFAVTNLEDTDELSPWNVIPDIKVTNPTIEYDIEEYFGKIRRGCIYQVTEKNYDLTFSKNSEFDSEFEDSHIEIRITDKDYIIISFGIKEINISKNGRLKTEYMIDEDSIYITGKLDNKTVQTKYSTNCSRELTLGNLTIYSLSGRDSFNIVLGVLNSRKRVSLTFVINEYNVVNDDLIIDTLESKDISIEPFDFNNYLGRYVETAYDSLDYINLNEENDSIRDTWFTYGALQGKDLKYSTIQSSLNTTTPNSYFLCDITYNITSKRYTYVVKFIGEKDSNLQSSFPFNPTSYLRIPKDLTRVVIDDDYYNTLMRNADLMGVSKDNEYNLCFDSEKILSMCYKSTLDCYVKISYQTVIDNWENNDYYTLNYTLLSSIPTENTNNFYIKRNEYFIKTSYQKVANNWFYIYDDANNIYELLTSKPTENTDNFYIQIILTDSGNIVYAKIDYQKVIDNWEDYYICDKELLTSKPENDSDNFYVKGTVSIETNQETGEDEAVCGDIRVALKDIKVNVHVLCKNKLILIHQNVPITESFKFCYEDYFGKYGHINGIVISDSDNNPLQILSLDVSFIPFIKANSIIKRIYDTPVMLFDDATSQIKSNGDYDNLLPNFSLYRDKLDSDITENGKLGYLSKLDYNNIDSYTYLLSINNKFSPIVISYNTSNTGSLKSYVLSTDNSKEVISFDTDIIDSVKIDNDNIISPYSMQYIGYVMYYLNMAYLKKLNWLKLTDSEDIIYYLILLDKLSNNEDNFYKFKEEYLKSIDINGIRNVNLFENSWFKMTIKYIDFFERNYDKIVSEWQNRIDAYQLLLDVLSEYDSSIDLVKQIDKYLDKIPNIDTTKREKIYYIITEKTTNNIKQDSWAVSQINNRIWDNSSMHYVWKNVFEIMFGDQFNFDIINDAILRDINSYGFYPIIQIPEMNEDDMYIPYRLSFEGEIEESIIDGEYAWNGSQEPIYNYIFNKKGQIIGISRLFELDKPLIKSWKVNKITSPLEDKNGNTVFDYFIKDKDEDGWGMLIDKNNLRYNINIKGQFIKYNTSKTPIEYRITNNFESINLIDILNNWEYNVFYCNDTLIKQKSELLSDEATSTILKHNTFLDTYELATEEFETEWVEISKQQAYIEWKDEVIFYKNENNEYQLVNEKDNLNSSKNYKYFYKVICKYGKDSTNYKKLSSITFERLLGKDYTKTVNYFGDVSAYWIDEDKSNLIKMKSNNLLEAIRVQKLLAELFISELNKTMYMINSLIIFKDMSTIVDNLKTQWEKKNGLTNLSYINKDYKRLLDFNLTYFTNTYNCIYKDDKTFSGIYSYAYQYYNGYTHTINEDVGSDGISIKLPATSMKTKYTDHVQINDDMLNLHLIVPQNDINYSKTANVSAYISGTYACVIVEPKNSSIQKFGIYPWNANKINITNDEEASQVASWSTSNIDVSGLPNFKDYDKIANYKEIDGNGFVNSYVVMRRLMAGDLDSAPAIEIAYNFYPEELLGLGKYNAYQYTYDYTVSMNSVVPWKWANTAYSYSYNVIEHQGNYKTNVFPISQKDLCLYSYTIVDQREQQLPLIIDENLSFNNSMTIYSYHYSYVLHSRPTYILSYKYASASNYLEEIIYDGIRDIITTSNDSSNHDYQIGYVYSYQNNFNIIKNKPYSYYSGLNLTIENILGLENANNKNVESSNEKINGFTISYCDYLNSETKTIESTKEYNYSYLAFNDINGYLDEIKPLSYKITVNKIGNFEYFVIDNNITFDSEILNINHRMYNDYSFFLGSVSQWQIVQDNVREINNALAYIYDNAPYTYKKTTYEDALNNYKNGNYSYGSSYENVTTEPQSNGIAYYVYSTIPEPDYFYDGRIDRNKNCNKIFWTSSQIDSKNTWIMFFDKYMLKNNNKLCGAYVRPFINKPKGEN